MAVGLTLRGGFRVLRLMMVVGGLLLVVMTLTDQSVIVDVDWVGLFYEVRVWLGTIWYGYVDSRDKLIPTKGGMVTTI